VLWFSAVLVAAVSNLDNLAAGFAYGVRDTRIGVVPNAVIAAVTMAGTAVALTSGRELGTLMPSSLAGDVGALIVISIGVGMVVAAIRALRRRVAAVERQPSARFDADSNGSVLFPKRWCSASRYR
jgi:putative Mn2+ efflux pump MntP